MTNTKYQAVREAEDTRDHFVDAMRYWMEAKKWREWFDKQSWLYRRWYWLKKWLKRSLHSILVSKS